MTIPEVWEEWHRANVKAGDDNDDDADEPRSWGGECTCPDGKKYLVGDNGDDCASLACIGGKISKECSDGGIPEEIFGMSVTCKALDTSEQAVQEAKKKVVQTMKELEATPWALAGSPALLDLITAINSADTLQDVVATHFPPWEKLGRVASANVMVFLKEMNLTDNKEIKNAILLHFRTFVNDLQHVFDSLEAIGNLHAVQKGQLIFEIGLAVLYSWTYAPASPFGWLQKWFGPALHFWLFCCWMHRVWRTWIWFFFPENCDDMERFMISRCAAGTWLRDYWNYPPAWWFSVRSWLVKCRSWLEKWPLLDLLVQIVLIPVIVLYILVWFVMVMLTGAVLKTSTTTTKDYQRFPTDDELKSKERLRTKCDLPDNEDIDKNKEKKVDKCSVYDLLWTSFVGLLLLQVSPTGVLPHPIQYLISDGYVKFLALEPRPPWAPSMEDLFVYLWMN